MLVIDGKVDILVLGNTRTSCQFSMSILCSTLISSVDRPNKANPPQYIIACQQRLILRKQPNSPDIRQGGHDGDMTNSSPVGAGFADRFYSLEVILKWNYWDIIPCATAAVLRDLLRRFSDKIPLRVIDPEAAKDFKGFFLLYELRNYLYAHAICDV